MSNRMLAAVVAAAAGLPWLHFRLFLELAARADWTTGMVGESPRLSYQALREALYVEPTQGRLPSRRITKQTVRSALRTLEREGLIEAIGTLVFRVRCLAQDSCVQNNLYTICTPIRTHQESENLNGDGRLRVVHSSKNTHTKRKSVHTSMMIEKNDDGGFDTQSTTSIQESLSATQLARLFVEQRGFPAGTITEDCMSSFRTWEGLGVTTGTLLHVVELVDARLARRGLGRPTSPRYYHHEMLRVLGNENSRRAGEARGH